jgi:hypothetical protein
VAVAAGLAHHLDDLIRPWRVRLILDPLVRGARRARYPGIDAADRRRPAASMSTIDCCTIKNPSR